MSRERPTRFSSRMKKKKSLFMDRFSQEVSPLSYTAQISLFIFIALKKKLYRYFFDPDVDRGLKRRDFKLINPNSTRIRNNAE